MFSTRQSNRKATALSVARAFRTNRSVVRFNEALHQGQPKAKPAMRARLGSIFLAKAIEDKRQKVRSDALTSILDTHERILVGRFADDLHDPAGFRKLDRVVQQIRKSLHQSRL